MGQLMSSSRAVGSLLLGALHFTVVLVTFSRGNAAERLLPRVAATGEAAGGTRDQFFILDGVAAVNAAGDAAFRAQAGPGGAGGVPPLRSGIWKGVSGPGLVEVLALRGDPSPGGAAGPAGVYGAFSLPQISPGGAVTFLADTDGNGLLDALFAAASSEDVKLVATVGSLGVARFDNFLLGTSGVLVVLSEVGIHRGAPGQAFEAVARVGDPAPDVVGASFSTIFPPAVAPDGKVAFRAFLTGGGVNADNDLGLWNEGPAGLELLAREGAAAPALAANGNQLFYVTLGSDPAINGRGEAAFGATLRGGTLETSGIFRGVAAADAVAAALRGVLAASDVGSISFTSFGVPALGVDGSVYFAATASHTPPDPRPSDLRSVTSLWRVSGAGVSLAAGWAGAAPGASELLGAIRSFSVNEHGRIAYLADLYDLGLARGAGFGLWSEGADGIPSLHVRTGDTVPISPEDTRTVASSQDAIQLLDPWRATADALRRGPEEGLPPGLSGSARPTYRLRFTGGGALGSYGLFSSQFFPAPPGVRNPVVNSTGDAGDADPGDGLCDTGGQIGDRPECTLRAAIEQVNALAELSRITFAIEAPGLPVLFPSSPLPTLRRAILLDASTQPGGRVALDGRSAGAPSVPGLAVEGDGARIQGLTITGFSGHGLVLFGADGAVSSLDSSANGGAGVFVPNAGLDVTGDLKLIGNSGEGLYTQGDVSVTGAHHDISSNGLDGITSPLDVSVAGELRLVDNGKRRPPAGCGLESWGGIVAGGTVTLGVAELRSNCGDGVRAVGDIHIEQASALANKGAGIFSEAGSIFLGAGNHEVSSNGLEGISSPAGTAHVAGEASFRENGEDGIEARDVELAGPGVRVEQNGKDGIHAGGTVSSTAPLFALGNGRRQRAVDCSEARLGGIVAARGVELVQVTSSGNCGSGIYCDLGPVTTGPVVFEENTQFGIWCPAGVVTLEEGPHTFLQNGKDGVFAFAGPIRIVGTATLHGNGRLWDPSLCRLEKHGALATTTRVEAGDLDLEGNCGSGIAAGGLTAANVRSVGNTRFGVLVDDVLGCTLTGSAHELSQNGEEGILSENSPLHFSGRAVVRNNGTRLSPAVCSGEVVVTGGIRAAAIVGGELESTDNCGAGAVGHNGIELEKATALRSSADGLFSRNGSVRLLGTGHSLTGNGRDGVLAPAGLISIAGTLTANENGRNGLAGGAVTVTAGEICRNAAFAIDLFGSGNVRLGSVNVTCLNGAGGVRLNGGAIVSSPSPGLQLASASNPSPGDAPEGMEFPADFVASSAAAGAVAPPGGAGAGGGDPILAAQYTLELPAGGTPETWYNYGPTLERPEPHWYEFLFDGATGAELQPGQVRVHLKDGERGDDDLARNGRLSSLGGAARSATLRPQLPGDCNQDGRLNIADAVCVLGFLFLGNPVELPCGDGSGAAPGNLVLLDWQADGTINLTDAISALSFLFLGGPPHVLGGPEVCAPIPGCPTSPACP